jgi:hypothetical protein
VRTALLLLLAIILPVHAADPAGTWQYDKGAEYFGQLKPLPPPRFQTLQISNGQLILSTRCIVPLTPQSYAYDVLFQSLLKEDVDEAKLTPYLSKQFAITLIGVKTLYEAERHASRCNLHLTDFIVTDNALLVPFAGSAFYRFVRGADTPQLYGRKTSQLPFNSAAYSSTCLGRLPISKGVPQATTKCGPVYMPYVAADNGDALSQLIGTHDYQQGGARYADDYANPFANKLHPVFVMLPPMEDVLLVRVDDMEPGPNEQRDVMSGVFLAIKDDKVTDQLNQGCLITSDYACVDEDGKRQYQLLESGKFQKLK